MTFDMLIGLLTVIAVLLVGCVVLGAIVWLSFSKGGVIERSILEKVGNIRALEETVSELQIKFVKLDADNAGVQEKFSHLESNLRNRMTSFESRWGKQAARDEKEALKEAVFGPPPNQSINGGA